jgi:hypothetical protein
MARTVIVEQLAAGVYRTELREVDGLVVLLGSAASRWHQCGDIVICPVAVNAEAAKRRAEKVLSRFGGAVVVVAGYEKGCVFATRKGCVPRVHGRVSLSAIIERAAVVCRGHLAGAESADPEFAERPRAEGEHAESGGVVNDVSGDVRGNVVQAREIHGDISFH